MKLNYLTAVGLYGHSNEGRVFMPSRAELFEEANRFFIKAFLIDDSVNKNNWGVTTSALERRLQTAVGKPLITYLRGNFLDHPPADSGDELLVIQEQFRVGNIVNVGIDPKTRHAFAVAEVTDPEAIDMIKSGKIFVSPAVVFKDQDVKRIDGKNIVQDFQFGHLAIVKQPAYDEVKSQIVAHCTGTNSVCESELAQATASDTKSLSSIVDGNRNKNTKMPEGDTEKDKILLADYEQKIKDLELKLQAKTEKEKTLEKDNTDLDAAQKRITDLEAKLAKAEKMPSIEKIVTAKIALGQIKEEAKDKEIENLLKSDAASLTSISSEYANLVTAKKELQEKAGKGAPHTRFEKASSDEEKKEFSELIRSIHGD